ncbi:MAG TPA: branched-chain amino acid ABC transporter permease [Kineosporiaceae bacterium]
MASVTSATPAPGTTSRNRLAGKGWPIGFGIAVLLVFSLFEWILPNMSGALPDFFERWLPLTVVNQCLIWAIMAIGLNIVVGYAGLLDLGYVAFWAIGGYTAGWFMSGFFTQVKVNVFGHPAVGQASGFHINFWFVLVIAAAHCALWGVLIGAPTLRLKSDYLALVTLGFGEIIPEFFKNADDLDLPWAHHFDLSHGTRGITPIDAIPTGVFHYLSSGVLQIPAELGPFDDALKFLVYSLVAAFAIFVSLRIREGRLGRAWLAIREDELAASMMGVPLMRTKLAAYAVGAAIGGIGGVCYTSAVGGVAAEDFAFSSSIILLAMVVLGGMGNVWGVLTGALVLQWINGNGLKELGNTITSVTGHDINFPSYNFLIFGAILILMMLFRREGLLPETRTRQVLREPERGELESVGADLEGEPV